MSETWEELFSRFENRYVLVTLDTDAVTIRNLPVFLTRITVDSHHLTLEVRGGGRIRFASTYEPYLDEEDNLACINDEGGSLTVGLAPAQPVP